MTELNRHSDYTSVSRARSGDLSPARRLMDLRADALIDRARIVAEVANRQFAVHVQMNAGFAEAHELAELSAELRRVISETGNDPELHQLHSLMKLAGAEEIMNLIQGGDQR